MRSGDAINDQEGVRNTLGQSARFNLSVWSGMSTGAAMGSSSDVPLSTKRWAVWLAATVVSFGALEAHAVSTRRQPTLSGALRLWMGHDPVKPHRWVASLLWLAFWSWLTGHLLLSWPPNLKER